MKIVKTTTNSYDVLFVNADKPIFVFGDFIKTREKHGMSTAKFKKCFCCGHSFKDDEDVYFASIEHEGNMFFCHDCALKAKEG